MKTKHIFFTGAIAVAMVGMVITGCKKSNEADTDATAAQDDANASFVMNDSKEIADGTAKGQATERAFGGPCGVLSRKFDTVIGSATDTAFDIFFPAGCTSPDGRKRQGHILVFWNGKGYFQDSAQITEVWKNYSVTTLSGMTITMGSGSYRTLTNIGKDSLGDHSWKFTANLSMNYSTGGSATWTSNRTNILTYTAGLWYYVITGSANGTSKSGVSYTLNITQPLYWTAFWLNGGPWWSGGKYCDCIEQGQIELTRSGKTYPLYLTFTSGIGVGHCNHTATATINGTNYNITLP